MSSKPEAPSQVVRAVHGRKTVRADPPYEIGLSEHLKQAYSRDALVELYNRFGGGDGELDFLMRRVIWRALVRRLGNGVTIGSGVGFKHLETFEIGSGVFIGAHSYLQGRHDGRFVIGDMVWIGPQSYFDARDTILGDFVGWGPGAKILGSMHTGIPVDVPVIQSDLEIKPVRVEPWADIGTNSTILPGVTIGKGSIVGAGSVVTGDVPPFAIVAGVPARFLRWREGHQIEQKDAAEE